MQSTNSSLRGQLPSPRVHAPERPSSRCTTSSSSHADRTPRGSAPSLNTPCNPTHPHPSLQPWQLSRDGSGPGRMHAAERSSSGARIGCTPGAGTPPPNLGLRPGASPQARTPRSGAGGASQRWSRPIAESSEARPQAATACTLAHMNFGFRQFRLTAELAKARPQAATAGMAECDVWDDRWQLQSCREPAQARPQVALTHLPQPDCRRLQSLRAPAGVGHQLAFGSARRAGYRCPQPLDELAEANGSALQAQRRCGCGCLRLAAGVADAHRSHDSAAPQFECCGSGTFRPRRVPRAVAEAQRPLNGPLEERLEACMRVPVGAAAAQSARVVAMHSPFNLAAVSGTRCSQSVCSGNTCQCVIGLCTIDH
jgi:hypothetical protein